MTTVIDAPLSVPTSSSGGSRLAQMQARFQQKQMQEKEQKLLRLYESQTQKAFQRVGRGSAGSSSSSVSSTSSSFGAGKVRQLFQERRQQNRSNGNSNKTVLGWDRSYPLEPLENTTTVTKQHLQISKSTGNLKTARGTSLERSYSNSISTDNQFQLKNQARRSKSQVRSNSNPQNVVVDLGGSFRQLTHPQQNHYYDNEDNAVSYPCNRYSPEYQDEENNRTYIERDQREAQLFNQHRIYDNNVDENEDDIENEDPPFQQLDYDDDTDVISDFHESSHVFQKLPNVGGRLQMENRANNNNNNNNNMDKYKTYNATTNGIRNNRKSQIDKEDKKMTPNSTTAKEPLRRRDQDVTTTKLTPQRASPTTKKPDAKLNIYTASRGPTQRTTSSSKPDSANKQNSAEPASWEKKSAARKTVTEDTDRQMIQRGSPPRRPPARGPQPATQSATNRGQNPTARTPLSRPGQASKAFSPASNADSAECKICGRHFGKDRIGVHENICSKTSQKKRKVFDPTKQRVRGTEAEHFLKKGKPPTVSHMKKTNWRQKHEDFINSIRAAKEMKAHIAKGGKLSDLPPPPPSDYSDYVQCPHCSRRFNQQAAERHIPKCATYVFNKPKSQGGGAGKGRGAIPKKR